MNFRDSLPAKLLEISSGAGRRDLQSLPLVERLRGNRPRPRRQRLLGRSLWGALGQPLARLRTRRQPDCPVPPKPRGGKPW